MTNINIACCTDNNYVQHMLVMLCSLLENAKSPSRIKIYVLGEGVKLSHEKTVTEFVQRYGAQISFIKINPRSYKKLKVSKHVTRAVYYRLGLADILCDINKVIYLDVDLVVEDDISKLWEMPLRGKHLLAATNMGTYFNSGVMVINLELWRKDRIGKRVFDYIVKNRAIIKAWDQDGLNAVLSQSFGPLEQRWNARALYFMFYFKDYDEAKYRVQSNPAIIHFTGPVKPWHYFCAHPKKSRYKHYLSKTPWANNGQDYSLLYLKYYFYPNFPKYMSRQIMNVVKMIMPSKYYYLMLKLFNIK